MEPSTSSTAGTPEQLAAEIPGLCVATLNDDGHHLDGILSITSALKDEGVIDEEEHQSVASNIGRIRGALKQMTKFNGEEGRYEPLESEQALRLLKERIRSKERYPFASGTTSYVVGTYAQALKPMLDVAVNIHDTKNNKVTHEGITAHADALYARISSLMDAAAPLLAALDETHRLNKLDKQPFTRE